MEPRRTEAVWGRRRRGLFALPFLALAAVSCAHSAGQDPESVLRTYARALDAGRAEEAYRLLSAEAKRDLSFDHFKRVLREDPDGTRELAKSLSRPSRPAAITATITSASGEELLLTMEDGKWRIDASAIQIYGQDTPRQTIVGFVKALEKKRYDVILRYVPESHREGLDAEKLKAAWEGDEREDMARVLSGVKAALPEAPIEETGDRAAMAYGSGTLLLVREHGAWMIEDFD